MSILGRFTLKNKMNVARFWEKLGSNFDNMAQAIFEFVDNAVSNFRGHGDNADVVRAIRIVLRNLGEQVEITVEDGGTGIKDLDNAMTVAGADAQESPLNEHGFGLKHALAYMDKYGCSWELATRDEVDRALNRYRCVKAPYDIEGEGSYEEGWIGSVNSTGTVIRFCCPMSVFETLAPNRKKAYSFEELLRILNEHLSYTYADILEKGGARIEVVHERITDSTTYVLQPLLPEWREGTLVERTTESVAFGAGKVEIECSYGAILPSEENCCYYAANMNSSGVEIRINGRVVEYGRISNIWGKRVHPSYNSFLARINLKTDQVGNLPETRTTKTGFRAGDPMRDELYKWIRKNVEMPKGKILTREQKLIRALAEKLTEKGYLVQLEKDTFCALDVGMRIDLYVSKGDRAVIYEGKAGYAKCIHVYQLRMYWDGCIYDEMPVDEGVLIVKNCTEKAARLMRYLNGLNGPDGKPYNFRMTTWKDEEIDPDKF